jgi:hypothetical protein
MPKQKEQHGLLTVRDADTGSELKVEVIIKELRQKFGRTDYLVTPVAGSGEAWKSEANLKLV